MVNVTGKTNKPRWGEDLFLFAILDRGIIPFGDVGWQKNLIAIQKEKVTVAGGAVQLVLVTLLNTKM